MQLVESDGCSIIILVAFLREFATDPASQEAMVMLDGAYKSQQITFILCTVVYVCMYVFLFNELCIRIYIYIYIYIYKCIYYLYPDDVIHQRC